MGVTYTRVYTVPSQPQSITTLLTGTELHCLVTVIHWCKQLAQSCYLIVTQPGNKPTIIWS